ncbi:MAG: hypothetical protein BroJett011_59350 [Chloroflexota bacterium]|nr:MAG: hypothetical protein BroJett011_59350 [Chloroflexota bacterium]
MSYSQLIQFKRLEERAFIFLNGKQVMLSAFGFFAGMSIANRMGLTGWPVWIAVLLFGALGLVIGARYHGLYGYQYIRLLLRTLLSQESVAHPEKLYNRHFDEDMSYVLGAPDGGALVQVMRQPASAGAKPGSKAVNEDGSIVYRLRPVDLAQHPPQAIGMLMHRWGGFWAGARPPIRLIVHSEPFFADEVVEEARSAGLIAKEGWRAYALATYSRFLERLTREAAMYQAQHELIVWANSDTEAHATVSSLASFMGVSASKTELTPLLECEYQIGFDHLEPADPRKPYIILMVSHEFLGEWTWADPLVTILRQAFPISLAVDVERNLAPNDALKELVKYENVLMDVIANNKTGRDPKAEGALQDVRLAMAKANAGQSLHFSTVVVAVKGTTLAEVKANVATIRTITAARLALVALPGGQGELLKFFTTTRRKMVKIPEISHNITSDGMAVVSGPLGFRRRSDTTGIFWGIGSSGGHDTYPIWWDGFGKDLQKPAAYHGLFLGKSGYGKTVSINALLYREALRGTQVVLMEPQGHSRRLAELVGRGGATYNPLSLRTMQLNPLDPISDNLNEQKAYEISLYRLMLKQVDPERRLTMQEAGLLDASLGAVYDGLTDPLRTSAIHVPRLEQLCQELRRRGAKQLAMDLELNYVDGSMGSVYNQPTNLDVALEADVVTYDFKDIPNESRALIYTLVLGRVQRIVRSFGRVRRRVVAIDEFGWMAQEPMLAETVAMWIKTFRTFGCGIWMAEQDLIRLTGGITGDLSGHSIIGNSVFQLFFNHEPAAAEVVTQTFPNVAPYRDMLETFQRPQDTGVAEAILRLPDGAYHTYMLLSDIERSLVGS